MGSEDVIAEVVCLACGTPRLAFLPLDHESLGECVCGYVGWAQPEDIEDDYAFPNPRAD